MAVQAHTSSRSRPGKPAGGERSPSLQRKLLLGMLVLVMLPTLVGSWWLSRIAREAMVRRHVQAVATVSETLAGALNEPVTETAVAGHPVLRTLRVDPNLAFAAVFDTQGREIYRYTTDHEAHAAYDLWSSRRGRGARHLTSQAIRLSRSGDIIAWQARGWQVTQIEATEAGDTPPAPRLTPAGTVVVALKDRGLVTALGELQAAQFAAATLVCLLSVPIIIWFARRWTHPLREMVAVVRRLAHGQMPQAVAAGAHSEIGDLLGSFNQMARDLYATQLRLQRANEALAQQVDQRTCERDDARAELETEIRQRHEFLEILRDELGARLNNIDAMATTLLVKYRDELDDDLEHQLQRIDAHVQQQSARVGELLALTSLRNTPGRRERVDLDGLLADLAQRFEAPLSDADITLHTPGDRRALPTLTADRQRLERVFGTLFENAITHMGDAPTRQIVLAFENDPGHDDLRFTVSDTGAGIAPERHPRLFDPFIGHTGGHGIGLGLAAVKAVVESYGGRIWVESEPGKGTVFHFTLDRRKVEEVGLVDEKAA